MEDTPNVVLNGLSPEARRNSIETASLTPRDKENAGANSTRDSQSESVDQSKVVVSATAASTPPSEPPAKTPSRLRLTNQALHQKPSPSFFSMATTPSPVAATATSSQTFKDSASTSRLQQKQNKQLQISPATTTTIASFASPPGTSQVLRKHFQSLGFATPTDKHPQQQRLLSTGAVRLTPSSRKKAQKGSNQSTTCMRVGYDGTKHTPSKELLKSTTSSRNQRILGLQDMSMEQPLIETHPDNVQVIQDLQRNQQQQPALEPMIDDETSTVASSATMDDASFDMSVSSVNQPPFSSASNILPAPHSPLTPRMGCLDPVALTLLNDGKEDYHYLLTQDALYPISKFEDASDATAFQMICLDNLRTSSSSATSPSCLSPTPGFGQSPAEVRGTLSHKVRSSLARPVAIMAKSGRVSPTTTASQPHIPRLAIRTQPKHVR